MPPFSLSRREHEILRHIALGASNRGIAVDLGLSERTVEAHVRNVFEKLGLSEHPWRNRRVEAARLYLTGAGVAVAAARPPIRLAYPMTAGAGTEIMPAPTVPFVEESIRMKPPVERLAS